MTPRLRQGLVLALALLWPATPALATTTQVFSTDFETGIPVQFSAPGAIIDGVQGYAGLGPAGRQFGGSFLHYTAVTIYPTKLTVRNLPPHDYLSVKFLLGIIDSWDSTEILQISVDGSMRFEHRFSLALADTTTYFPAPPGAILSMGTNLGFSGCCYYNRDRAYDLGVDPAFLHIAHTADSVQVVWNLSALSGPAANQWQGGGDESWAIDAVRVEVEAPTTDVASELHSGGLGLAGALPNPAHDGRLTLYFALPGAAPATLELLDLSGRLVASREVGTMGAGTHSVGMPEARSLAPGMYFARLRQGPHERLRRIVLID